MSGILKAVNPFLERIPRELHDQYITDLVELVKLDIGKANNTDDSVFPYKAVIIVAFARKT
jgi:hypothetical protein